MILHIVRPAWYVQQCRIRILNWLNDTNDPEGEYCYCWQINARTHEQNALYAVLSVDGFMTKNLTILCQTLTSHIYICVMNRGTYIESMRITDEPRCERAPLSQYVECTVKPVLGRMAAGPCNIYAVNVFFSKGYILLLYKNVENVRVVSKVGFKGFCILLL